MLDHSHDRHVDRVPAEARHASFGKVLPFDVPGSIPIRVNLIAAGQAQENRLSRSIPLMHEAASGAPLRRVTRIDANHFAPDFLCLVGREGSKLPVTPGMMPPALFPAPLLCPAADVGEVFEDNNAARFHALDNPFAQNMVAIFPKPCLPAAYLLQMTLCRLAAFGLKLATKPEVPLFNLLPSFLSKKDAVGQDGGSVDAEIDADDMTGRCNLGSINGDYDVEPPTRGPTHKVCAVEAGSPVKPAFAMVVKVKRKLDAAFHRGKSDKSLLDLHAVGSCVIPNGTPFSVRSANLLALLQQCEGGFNSLRRLHSGRDHQLAWKGRVIGPQIVVGRLVQRHTVPYAVFPAVFRNRVEAVPASLQRPKQDGILFGRGFDADGDSALHSSYTARNLPMFNLCSACVPHFLSTQSGRLDGVSMRGVR
jgi:hypothetical protein